MSVEFRSQEAIIMICTISVQQRVRVHVAGNIEDGKDGLLKVVFTASSEIRCMETMRVFSRLFAANIMYKRSYRNMKNKA